MASGSTHTTDEIEAAGRGLMGWAKGVGGVIAVAAMLGEDDDGPVPASRPEAVLAGAMGTLNEAEIAVLLTQLEVAVLMVLSRMAEGAEMGEERFRRIANTARRQLLDGAGLDLCDDCGG